MTEIFSHPTFIILCSTLSGLIVYIVTGGKSRRVNGISRAVYAMELAFTKKIDKLDKNLGTRLTRIETKLKIDGHCDSDCSDEH